MVDYRIIEEVIEKCSKPHITSLPYDNRVSDPSKLTERKNEIENRISNINSNIEKNKEGLSLLTNILQSNMTNAYDNHMERILQGVYSDFNINSMVDTQAKRVNDTKELYRENGYGDEYDLISNDVLSIYDTVRVLSNNMKHHYEQNIINNTVTDSVDMYDKFNLTVQLNGVIESCDNLDKNINRILKDKNFPFKNIKNIPNQTSKLKEDMNTVLKIYENYKQGVKTNRIEERKLSDLEKELIKVNDKL